MGDSKEGVHKVNEKFRPGFNLVSRVPEGQDEKYHLLMNQEHTNSVLEAVSDLLYDYGISTGYTASDPLAAWEARGIVKAAMAIRQFPDDWNKNYPLRARKRQSGTIG